MADTSLFENRLGILIWKTSNFWQSSLRKILVSYNVSLNEYLVHQSLKYLSIKKTDIFQNQIGEFIGIDISVTSVTLKLLESKKYISRETKHDNRKKIIKILKKRDDLYKLLYPMIEKEEERLFNKLDNETFNFINSLKLLLGKKIRIKAKKINQI